MGGLDMGRQRWEIDEHGSSVLFIVSSSVHEIRSKANSPCNRDLV